MSKYWKFAFAATALIATTAFAVAADGIWITATRRADGRNGRGHARANRCRCTKRMMQGEASGGHKT